MKQKVSNAVSSRKVFNKALSQNLPFFNPTHIILFDILGALIVADWVVLK